MKFALKIGSFGKVIRSDQISHSVMSTLCDPMNRSMPGLPVHHHSRVHTDSRPSSQ